jgi:hypothetical protein
MYAEWLALIFGLFGFALGGPLGFFALAFLGALWGVALDDLERKKEELKKEIKIICTETGCRSDG